MMNDLLDQELIPHRCSSSCWCCWWDGLQKSLKIRYFKWDRDEIWQHVLQVWTLCRMRIRLRQSMRINSKKNPVKFYPDPVWRGRLKKNRKKNDNKKMQ